MLVRRITLPTRVTQAWLASVDETVAVSTLILRNLTKVNGSPCWPTRGWRNSADLRSSIQIATAVPARMGEVSRRSAEASDTSITRFPLASYRLTTTGSPD